MAFAVGSQNILADSYIKPEYFPHSAPEHLAPKWRWPALVAHLERLDADVLCLQECEPQVFDLVKAPLEPGGYAAIYFKKTGNKPDGCATFHRRAKLVFRGLERFVYSDGSGHVALLVELEHEGRVLTVANTHVKWQPPGTPLEGSHGILQTTELLDRIERGPCRSWIACGDFNATPESEIIQRIEARGFRCPYPRDAFTANANDRRKKIDYLFATSDLVGHPRPLRAIEDKTPLPGLGEPSDHLAVVADFEWSSV
ncbi:MAG: endonuclease/exonuclease/phosphatase family protein [Planctomycetota bacterium]